MTTSRALAACLLAAAAVGRSTACAEDDAPAVSETTRVERLAALGRLWTFVKFFHPWIADRDVDWDAAFLDAVPKAGAAKSDAEYADAVRGMVAALGDPATYVVPKRPVVERSASGAEQPAATLRDDGIAVVTFSNYADLFVGARKRAEAMQPVLDKARGIVFDLRAVVPPTERQRETLNDLFLAFEPRLSSTPVSTPHERRRRHVGFPTQMGRTAGGYRAEFWTADARTTVPAKDARDVPLAFVVNADSGLPPIAVGLQRAGKAAIVAEGAASDRSLVLTRALPLPGGVEVLVRMGEIQHDDGVDGVRADAVVPVPATRGADDPALAAALEFARGAGTRTPRAPAAPRGAPKPERPYATPTYPDAPMRVLAAVRIWGTLNWFHPYRPMIGEDWDAVLPEFIPKFEAARDATEYALAVAEMTTHVHDGHAIVRSDALEQWFGVAAPAVRVRFVEDQPVVVEFPGKTLPEGVSIGDVVVSVDGEPSKARAERLGKYMASSTPQALADYVGRRFLRGPTDSKAVLELRGASGAARRVELPRTPVDKAEGRHARGGDVVRILPGNIGYADLDRLLVKDVEPMFGALKDTDAIVFDMRGYPNSTASMIAPRLTARESPIAARFTCPILIDRGTATTPEPDTSEAFVFGQRLPPTKRPRYLRPTVMLIDGGTQSQAEHTGLFCEAANGTKFVGGPTAGANGDVTWFLVPGGISVAFSGQAVAHADGRPLQRVGLQPDVPAAPTIAGVRAGKDEVLDAALAYLAGVLKK